MTASPFAYTVAGVGALVVCVATWRLAAGSSRGLRRFGLVAPAAALAWVVWTDRGAVVAGANAANPPLPSS
jgi:hypothetical protein